MLPEAHTMFRGLQVFQEEIAARSNGELEVIIHYGGPGDVAKIDMINANEMDVAVVTIWSAWGGLTEMANFESLPFVFDNYEEAWAAYEGELGAWVERNVIIPTGGGAILSFFTNGLRHFTNNVRPIHHPADLSGLRMRSPQNATHLAMYETFGAASLAMALGPLFAALQEGSVDGQDNPIGNIYANRFHEVQRYLTLSNHMYSAAPMVASSDFWNALTPAQQQIVREASLAAARYQGELAVALEQEQVQSMIAQGVQVNEVDPTHFVQGVERIWRDHMEQHGNEFATIASRYIANPHALAHRFGDRAPGAPPIAAVEDVAEYEEEYEEYDEDNGEAE
jgi:tripartite ATP-independent transporter DctP family solute receptor